MGGVVAERVLAVENLGDPGGGFRACRSSELRATSVRSRRSPRGEVAQQRLDVDAGVDRLPIRRSRSPDRTQDPENASLRRSADRTSAAHGRVACRIGAAREMTRTAARCGPLRHQRQRRSQDGVVRSRCRPRGWTPARARCLHVFFGLGPPGERPRPMVEREDRRRNSSDGSSRSERKRLDRRRARVLDALAEHAVADVETTGRGRPGRAFIGELRDGLALTAVFAAKTSNASRAEVP